MPLNSILPYVSMLFVWGRWGSRVHNVALFFYESKLRPFALAVGRKFTARQLTLYFSSPPKRPAFLHTCWYLMFKSCLLDVKTRKPASDNFFYSYVHHGICSTYKFEIVTTTVHNRSWDLSQKRWGSYY